MEGTSDIFLNLAAVGDISLGDHPVCVGHGMRNAFTKHGEGILRCIQTNFQEVDLTIGNLEGVTSNIGLKRHWLPSYEMRGNPEHLTWLKKSRINVLSIANNHAMQHGIDAFYDMKTCLEDLGFGVIGVEDSACATLPYYIKHDNVRSTIFAISTRPEEWAKDRIPYSLRRNTDSILAETAKLRDECSGFLICSIHWGLEFLTYPGEEQITLGHQLIDAGVDVILGHHPHVLQPIEEYKNGIIFYSLGNFVFDLWPKETKLTAIAKISLNKTEKHNFSIIPIVIDNNLSLRYATQEEANEVTRLLDPKRCNKELENPIPNEYYLERYKHMRKLFRYSSYRYFLKNIFRYPLHFLIQSFVRTILRRLAGR